MTTRTPAKVLYLANAARIGGGNRVLMDLILHLDRAAFTPLVVSPGEGELTAWARSAGVPALVCRDGDWHSAAGLARRSAALVRIILRESPAILHASAPTCFRALGLAGALLGRLRVCHLGFPPERGELERAFVLGPDAVVGCYDGQAAEHRAAITARHPRCRVVGIPNGIDIGRFSTRPPDAEGRALRAGARHVVTIPGHISDVKGHPTFVEAAARIAATFPETRFLAIGGENLQPGLRASLEARGAALGLGTRLQFLGFRTDVERVLAASDVVVLPSRAEGFPLAVLEAMASGKPVVATPVGGVAEAILDGYTGLLVPPADSVALADAVERLLGNEPLRQRIGTAARARIEERFSVQTFAASVQRLYTDLLHASPHAVEAAAATGPASR